MTASLAASQQSPIQPVIENAVQRMEPEWKCIHTLGSVLPAPHEKVLFNDFWERISLKGKQQEQAMLIVIQADSPDEAKKDFDLRFRQGKIASGWATEKIVIGDEGYFATYKGEQQFGVDFRIGATMFHINSRSREMARRLAELVSQVKQ